MQTSFECHQKSFYFLFDRIQIDVTNDVTTVTVEVTTTAPEEDMMRDLAEDITTVPGEEEEAMTIGTI